MTDKIADGRARISVLDVYAVRVSSGFVDAVNALNNFEQYSRILKKTGLNPCQFDGQCLSGISECQYVTVLDVEMVELSRRFTFARRLLVQCLCSIAFAAAFVL